MAPDPAAPAGNAAQTQTVMSRLLGAMSVFTMLMTVPQVLICGRWSGIHSGLWQNEAPRMASTLISDTRE